MRVWPDPTLAAFFDGGIGAVPGGAADDRAAAASGSLPAKSLIHRDREARGVSDSSTAAVGHDLVRRDQRATHGP